MTQLPAPPVFGVAGNDEKLPRNGIISLVDIFDDFLFSTNERQSDKVVGDDFLVDSTINNDRVDYDDESQEGSDDDSKPKKRARGTIKAMSEEQKIERRLEIPYSVGEYTFNLTFFSGIFSENVIVSMRKDLEFEKSFYSSPYNTV